MAVAHPEVGPISGSIRRSRTVAVVTTPLRCTVDRDDTGVTIPRVVPGETTNRSDKKGRVHLSHRVKSDTEKVSKDEIRK